MPKVLKQTARADIYMYRKRVPDESTKSGWRLDKSQPRDENDRVVIPKGSVYYKWSFRYGGTYMQLTYPKQSQLTQSEYLSTAYSIQEGLEELPSHDNQDDFEQWRDEIKESIETLRDETQEKYDNMPEGLQQGDTGQLLERRVEACDEVINELDNVDWNFDEVEDKLNEWLSNEGHDTDVELVYENEDEWSFKFVDDIEEENKEDYDLDAMKTEAEEWLKNEVIEYASGLAQEVADAVGNWEIE